MMIIALDFGTGEPNIINLDKDSDDDSDGFLLGIKFQEGYYCCRTH